MIEPMGFGQEHKLPLRNPGKRFLKYDKRQQAIVSVCNPVVCLDPHEKLEIWLDPKGYGRGGVGTVAIDGTGGLTPSGGTDTP